MRQEPSPPAAIDQNVQVAMPEAIRFGHQLQPHVGREESVGGLQASQRRLAAPQSFRERVRAPVRNPAPRQPELKGSVGEGPNQTNYSNRSSVRFLAKFRNFR